MYLRECPRKLLHLRWCGGVSPEVMYGKPLGTATAREAGRSLAHWRAERRKAWCTTNTERTKKKVQLVGSRVEEMKPAQSYLHVKSLLRQIGNKKEKEEKS